jgi:uncharacterized protein (TIGR02145 family)
MSIRKLFTVVSFCLMALSQNLFSQPSLKGVVTDNGSEPVINALVELINQADTTQKYHDRTNEQGQYEIPSTDVEGFVTLRPGQFNLLQNYPNPFNPSTVIGYELSHPSVVRIDIYNVLGRKVRTLVDGFQNMGSSQVIWDATDDGGQGVPAGVYIYSLKAASIRINRKMLLIDGQQGPSGGGVLQQTERDIRGLVVLKHVVPDQYLLRVTGTDIQTYEQPDLEFTGDSTLTRDVTVLRTVTDIDGNVYRTVKIGNQWWMAENLKVTHYRDGDPIPNVTDETMWSILTTGAYCNYDNNADNAAIYGRLYNWYVGMDYIEPRGWHVPSDDEWKELEMFLGMSQEEADSIFWFNSDWRGVDANAGGKLKETGTIHWKKPNEGATNESGFSALPGGIRYRTGPYNYKSYGAFFWTSTSQGSGGGCEGAFNRYLSYGSSGICRGHWNCAGNGCSIRCVKN